MLSRIDLKMGQYDTFHYILIKSDCSVVYMLATVIAAGLANSADQLIFSSVPICLLFGWTNLQQTIITVQWQMMPTSFMDGLPKRPHLVRRFKSIVV